MPDTQLDSPVDCLRLARALRFVVAAGVLGLACLAIYLAFSIHNFEMVYANTTDSRVLPSFTVWIFHAKPFFVLGSVIVLAVAVSTLFMRRVVSSFYFLGALALITIIESMILLHGLFLPFWSSSPR